MAKTEEEKKVSLPKEEIFRIVQTSRAVKENNKKNEHTAARLEARAKWRCFRRETDPAERSSDSIERSPRRDVVFGGGANGRAQRGGHAPGWPHLLAGRAHERDADPGVCACFVLGGTFLHLAAPRQPVSDLRGSDGLRRKQLPRWLPGRGVPRLGRNNNSEQL